MMIRGIEMELHANEAFSNHIRTTKDFYEADILDYIRDYHKHHEVIMDIGANIGNHSLYFANFLEYETLVAFEPIPTNYGLLIKNLTGSKHIQLYNYAVSDKRGVLKMREDVGNMGASTITKDGSIEVKTTTIDILNYSNVTLMKIDVENHEPYVLEGAKDTIFRCHPLILIEDWNNTYAKLLPDYELEKAWPEHRTYLYKWKV